MIVPVVAMAWWVAAEGVAVGPPGGWEQVGIVTVLVAVIAWLVRDRARLSDQVEEKNDRLLAQAERLIPIAEHMTQVAEAATEELKRARDLR